MTKIDISEWKPFAIGNIFDVIKGTRLTKAHMKSGDIRFIGSSSMNNGCTSLVGNTENMHSENTITVCLKLTIWLYHRIRMCIWKQWKLPRTKKRNLIKMGVHEYYANMAANCRRGHWYCANLTTVKKAMTKERLINSGFYDLATAYQSVHVNY